MKQYKGKSVHLLILNTHSLVGLVTVTLLVRLSHLQNLLFNVSSFVIAFIALMYLCRYFSLLVKPILKNQKHVCIVF